MTNFVTQRPESKDPCLGCQERQVCSAGHFVEINGSMRSVCVHPCDELDFREWLAGVEATRSALRCLANAVRPVVDVDHGAGWPLDPLVSNSDRAAVVILEAALAVADAAMTSKQHEVDYSLDDPLEEITYE